MRKSVALLIGGSSNQFILEKKIMLKNLTILILVLVAAAANLNAQKTDDKPADERAIRANIEQMMKGWNAKSGAEFAKPFAEDADYVVINGMQLKGRPVIEKSHQNIFDTVYKNTSLSMAVDSIRFLRPDVAVVHVSGALKLTEGDATLNNAKITMVMTKNGDRWEIAAFQNTPVQNADQKKK